MDDGIFHADEAGHFGGKPRYVGFDAQREAAKPCGLLGALQVAFGIAHALKRHHLVVDVAAEAHAFQRLAVGRVRTTQAIDSIQTYWPFFILHAVAGLEQFGAERAQT